MDPEPATATARSIINILVTLWERSALFLWCVASSSFVILAALYLGSYLQLGDFALWLNKLQTALTIAFLFFVIFASFRTLADRKSGPVLLLPQDNQCIWGRAKQPTGNVITQINIHFQATNTGDSAIMLSGIRLSRPWVRRGAIITDMLNTKHPIENTYSSRFPILAHSLTYGSATIIVDRPIGRLGKPMRVVVRLRDQRGRWHKLVCPHVTALPYRDPKETH